MSLFTVQRRTRGESKPKHLRKQGLLPMALVERTHETMLVQAPVDQLREAMRHADGLGRVDVQVEGEKRPRKAIVKSVELDAVRQELLHVTLQEISEDDQVKLEVPVVALGTPESTEGMDLLLMQVTDKLQIRGRMGDLPEMIEVDVTGMEMGSTISASDIRLPDGVELMSSADATLFSLKSKMSATEDVPEPLTEPTHEEEGLQEAENAAEQEAEDASG
jgi:large subunit ribosomal protein L25